MPLPQVFTKTMTFDNIYPPVTLKKGETLKLSLRGWVIWGTSIAETYRATEVTITEVKYVPIGSEKVYTAE